MQSNIDQLLAADPLPSLIQSENFVGWIYSIDYETALVMTNDLWKAQALGVPHNCFLVAASFDPNQFSGVEELDRELILLRVVGSAKLPQDDDLIRTKIDNFQRQQLINEEEGPRGYDDLTLNQLQFGGLKCRVLGTFYTAQGRLKLGSDLESFAAAASLSAYRPRGSALERIVNYVDPIRLEAAQEQARQLGITDPIEPFRIGTVRYTSADRIHRGADDELVPVYIQPSDFLARRTAVFGMTRTGKSNTVKQLVSVVKRVADASGVPIGQIIFDINGEYANPNEQDQGAIGNMYPDETLRYRMLRSEGFEELQSNFYLQLEQGFSIIREVLPAGPRASLGAQDVQTFLNGSFDEPDAQNEPGEYQRWIVRAAAYRAMLYRGEFEPPPAYRVVFRPNENVRTTVAGRLREGFPDPSQGLTLEEAGEWFIAARAANRDTPLMSTSNNPWLDEQTRAILNMLARRTDSDAPINGYRVLGPAIPYHSPRRTQEIGEEIYRNLVAGRIVILDLSVGPGFLREPIAERTAREIFRRSMEEFVSGRSPPNIMVYVEEAHNLLGRDLDLTDTWPRLAKEGAKYRIGLVYATQEVTSIHPNILANTENWFISHLNNEREINELARFYDFGDFSTSIIRAQDIGFTRIKTLSSPFVVPAQVELFEPIAAVQGELGVVVEPGG